MQGKLKCGCPLEPFLTVPQDNDFAGLTKKALRSYANAHGIGPDGNSAAGWSKWRNEATEVELVAALKAHREGHTLEITATPIALNDEAMEVLPQLASELSILLRTVNPDTVGELITSTIRKQLNEMREQVMPFEVVINGTATGSVHDLEHKNFKKLLQVMGTGVHVMLVGGAGSGKTEGAVRAAKALGKNYELISVGPQTLQSELAGYRTAVGEYVSSAARRAFESGKVLIIDELDAANPGVTTFLNATLSNAVAGYPDGVVERGNGFQVIACANTFGTGADMVYVGRSQQDGASLDRYVMMDWDYDETLELQLALQHNDQAEVWVKTVQRWRKNMMAHKIRHVISPRASINGAKLLAAGFHVDEVAKMTVFKGLNKEAVQKITQAVPVGK